MAYKVSVVDQLGSIIDSFDLDKSLFNESCVNESLMYDFVRMQNANSRISIASTKNRGEVRGSGKKLYKQKGNGSGRVGDKKSPLRKKGGVARGPRSVRNFSIKMPKKMRKAALISAFCLKASQDVLLSLQSFVIDLPSTKKALSCLSSLGIDRSLLLVVGDNNINTVKSYRNIPCVDIVHSNYISVSDLLKAKKVLFVEDALDNFISHLTK